MSTGQAMRGAAAIATVAGAAASLYCLRKVGHSTPPLLLGFFVIWVLAPFVTLIVAAAKAGRWPSRMRTTLAGVMLVVAVASPAVYALIAFGPPRPQPAFYFIIVPAAAWLLMLVAAVATNRRR